MSVYTGCKGGAFYLILMGRGVFMNKFIFTSESVTNGHPDKVCDIISDSILDGYLEKDPYARVAAETAVKNNTVILL